MMEARRGTMVERLVWVLVGVLPLLLLLLMEQGAEAGRPLVELKCEVIEPADEAQQELPLCEVGVDCSRWPLTTITSIATPYPYRGLTEIAPPAPSGGAAMPDPLPTLGTRPSPPPPLQPQLPPVDPLCFRNLDCFDVAPQRALHPLILIFRMPTRPRPHPLQQTFCKLSSSRRPPALRRAHSSAQFVAETGQR